MSLLSLRSWIALGAVFANEIGDWPKPLESPEQLAIPARTAASACRCRIFRLFDAVLGAGRENTRSGPLVFETSDQALRRRTVILITTRTVIFGVVSCRPPKITAKIVKNTMEGQSSARVRHVPPKRSQRRFDNCRDHSRNSSCQLKEHRLQVRR